MHSCPNCYEICHCDGDDLVYTGDEDVHCTHCPQDGHATVEEDDLQPEEITV